MAKIIFSLLGLSPLVMASAPVLRQDLPWPREDKGLLYAYPKPVLMERDVWKRQTPPDPPTTNIAQCDVYDGYFYVTPHNYTWQLQCTTNYEGSILSQQTATNYPACISDCIAYNRVNGAGACLAVTFNGPNDGLQGLCTFWSAVTDALLAYEEGNVQDSALLVRGPDGTIFATPRPEPSFSGQPSSPPTIEPLPVSTQSTTTIFSTSILFVTSCPPGAPTCAAQSTTTASADSRPSGPGSTTSPTASTPVSSIVISDAGPRPLPSTTAYVSPRISSTPSSFLVGNQKTFTSVQTWTEYVVQVVTVCPENPASCTALTQTSLRSGYRTRLTCSPGPCIGVMINTRFDAAFTAATCIASA